MSVQRIAVVGLGNLMRTDDAVGMLAIQRLRMDLQLPRGVTVIEGGTQGLELLYPLTGVTHLLALDAIDAGVEPGALIEFSGEAIASLPASKSAHLLGFADLIGAMQLTGDAPAEIVVLGIQPKTIDWGTALTPIVEKGLSRLIAAALEQIRVWKQSFAADTRKATPQTPLAEATG